MKIKNINYLFIKIKSINYFIYINKYILFVDIYLKRNNLYTKNIIICPQLTLIKLTELMLILFDCNETIKKSSKYLTNPLQ